MEEVNTSHHHPFHPTRRNVDRSTRDDWEDWEDDEPVTPADGDDNPLIEGATTSPARRRTTAKPRASNPRQSFQRITRLKSRARQKATIAKVGISLDTDIAKYRQRQQQHIAMQMNASRGKEPTRGKFVDAAALKALEGDPSTATVGSFHWLRKKSLKASKGKGPATELTRTPVERDTTHNGLTPNDRIMIGIALPPGAEDEISPQTAVIGTPQEFPVILAPSSGGQGQSFQPVPAAQQQQSVWSPDTEYTISAYPSSAGASSLRSVAMGRNDYIPPVPAIPPGTGGRRRTTIIEDDVDLSTPMTEFEEDGSPFVGRKSFKAKSAAPSPASPSALAARSQGWWDQITSPFMPSPSAAASPDGTERWWKDTSDASGKGVFTRRRQAELGIVPPEDIEKQGLSRVVAEAISPTIASSSTVEPHKTEPTTRAEEHGPPAPILPPSGEAPPPYSPPSKQPRPRYRAVFPPGHQLNALYPPSPGPMSPAMVGTMTSQGAISMTDVPLTPAPRAHTPSALPPRPLNTFISREAFLEATGRGPRQKAERQRRRHEKEEAIARKIGGLWKGRGCVPAGGCYGRAGREGRKKRRICCGVIGGAVGLLILIIVLAVTLTRHHRPVPTPYTQWLNLTDFPPIPTSISTVVGEDNSVTVSGCTNPPTLWSCTLPKEQASEAAPFQANQPKFIFNIQYDNSTDQAWNVTGQQAPISRRNIRTRPPSSYRSVRRDPTASFSPDPAPPSFQEMWFLGNTTDSIQSPQKAGEPTPFYITLLRSLNSTTTSPTLSRRDLIFNTTNFPVPDLNPNGTGAPARLVPEPYQQPLRLYDRGLATEHYSFYTYFNKTIYLSSLAVLNDSSSSPVVADQNGGSLETEANYLVIWAQTRFKVEIWTRLAADSARFVGGDPLGTVYGTGNDTRPGSFPYPVTVTEDTHGGNRAEKGTWAYRVTDQQTIDTQDFVIVEDDIGFNGVVINPAATANLSLGGIDGGHSGCTCQWTNFITTNPGR